MHTLYTDGAARGNPGPAGIGVVLLDADGDLIHEFGKSIGHATNNVAEYEGLIAGLEAAAEAGARELKVFMDSVLVVRQMQGLFKVKHPDMRRLNIEAVDQVRRFERVVFEAIPRELNSRADALCNEGIDADL